MRKALLIAAFAILAVVGGCSRQQQARTWGGEDDFNLPACQKLVMVTWKDDNLWYLTRPMRDDDIVEIYDFTQNGAWGILHGVVHIHEHRGETCS